VSSSKLYVRAAESLRDNPGQWEAYESKGHVALLAGPGSGKTKTLTIKLARILAEDVKVPRGAACITYNNECARELETRLEALGVEPGCRVFIGTVHSFSLTQIVLPYAKSAKLGLPDDFRVATNRQQRAALEVAHSKVIGGPGNPHDLTFKMGTYRRSILNRDSADWRDRDPEMAKLVVAYEAALRANGLIDFDDMPLLAVKALREHEWVQRAIFAKFPVLVVDEYQDLGRALHRMVLGLCFSAGIRLVAVGDVDQSIYGFAGANPALLQQVAGRDDVQAVRLKFNYRSGTKIITASEYALGEVRGYAAPPGSREGTIFFHSLTGNYHAHADHLFAVIVPTLLKRLEGLAPGDIAVLYSAAWIGDSVAQSAEAHGYAVVRADTNALYPRSSRLLRWLELCAAWSCRGWRAGSPRFRKLHRDGCQIFGEALISDDTRLVFQRDLLAFLWARRDPALSLHSWLGQALGDFLTPFFNASATLDDERANLEALLARTDAGGDAGAITLGTFAGNGDGRDRVNLSTLHSAKGREFRVVVLFGMDEGRIPRNNASQSEKREARRLFYVGFTRPKEELHILHTLSRPSSFVTEVRARIENP
jgi:DNA helicase-2/ATP-dependent DNA helicase PcrA